MMNQDELERMKKLICNQPISKSPTDYASNGMYEYQEPEVDEQGTYYGYKILYWHSCPNPKCTLLVSPRYESLWVNGELHANHVPTEDSMFGIHCTKRPDHPELEKYIRYSHLNNWVLVRCALSGTIAHTDQGFRAEHAQIVGVYINGYWQNYQDYERLSQSYSRRDAQEEIEWKRYYYGDWNPHPDQNYKDP